MELETNRIYLLNSHHFIITGPSDVYDGHISVYIDKGTNEIKNTYFSKEYFEKLKQIVYPIHNPKLPYTKELIRNLFEFEGK